MALTIRASSFFTKRYLKVTDSGIDFMETAAMGGRRKFSFSQIDYVLMSQENVLSFQVGREVFSIPINLGKPQHQQAVQQLVAWVGGSYEPRTGGFPLAPPPLPPQAPPPPPTGGTD